MAQQTPEQALVELQTTRLDTAPAVDEDDPMLWKTSKKWIVTGALSASGFNRIMVSTIMAPALPSISRELHLSSVESVLALCIFILATAFAPLLIGPLSELYGRAPLMHTTNVFFLIFNLLCGFAKNGPTLIAARLFAGLGAGAIYPISSGVMGDLWPVEVRGRTYALYLLVPLLGAAVGPVIGGFVETYSTWRWCFWSTSALQAVFVGVCFLCYKETHLPVILKNKQRSASSISLRSLPARISKAIANRQTWKLVQQSLAIPPRQLFTYRSVQIQALLSAFGYGIIYLVISSFSSLFTTQYNQSVAISGLHYFAICIGEIIGSQIGGRAMDTVARSAKRWTKADRLRPEFYLPVIPPGVLVACFGFILYGWAAQRRLHWAIVDVGVVILSCGMQVVGGVLQAYNMDAFPDSRASTAAAVQLFRSLGAFALPLAGPSLYASVLGYGWSNTILGSFYVLGNCSASWYLWKNGLALRVTG